MALSPPEATWSALGIMGIAVRDGVGVAAEEPPALPQAVSVLRSASDRNTVAMVHVRVEVFIRQLPS
jgi:hypothetical protein